MVDHRNCNGLHNYRSNLRFCTNGENTQNSRNKKNVKNVRSKYRGVTWYKYKNNKKWTAKIGYNNKMNYLGSYSSEEEAAKAYNIKAMEIYGEFARLNLI